MHISASQVKTFRRCPRLYSYMYVLGQKAPPTAKQQFGTDVHFQLERWLRDGRAPDKTPAGKVAAQGIQFLPVPDTNLMVEHKFEEPWTNRAVVMGFIDCIDPSKKIPVVIDHKTTSSLRWAMTEQELFDDPQALIYASWAMLHFQVPFVLCRWVYYAASNPQNAPRAPSGCSKTEVSFSALDRKFLARIEKLTLDINEMISIRQEEIGPDGLLANPSECKSFGGCPFIEECDIDQGSRLKAYFAWDEKLKK